MAIRNIRVMGDDILTKKCKPIKEMTEKNRELIQDLFDTMYEADGVGLAAPQVGILKRIAVVDITEDRSQPLVMINPEIISTEGEQRGSEGCLSVPDKVGIVTRPNKVKVKALDIDMNPIELEGEELLARALIHEIEHLDGQLYVDKIEGRLYDVEEFQSEEED
ncbi:MAG: peptide deformylase [Lachnospiraceae bacterium]|nr:peptide deformylase [Lachnospiraceae bacterium]